MPIEKLRNFNLNKLLGIINEIRVFPKGEGEPINYSNLQTKASEYLCNLNRKDVKVESKIIDSNCIEVDKWFVFTNKCEVTITNPDGSKSVMSQDFVFKFPVTLNLTDEQRHSIIRLASISQFMNPYFYGCVQTDAHPTSTSEDSAVWIGMTLNVMSEKGCICLPIFLVGGDIGCGMSVFGLTSKDGHIMPMNRHIKRRLKRKFLAILQQNISASDSC